MASNALTGLSRRQALVGGSSLVIGSGLGGLQPVLAQKRPLRWGSASLGSTGYVIIEALSSTVSRLTDIKGTSVATGGGTENMALIGRKEIDLGQTTSLDWAPAANGQPPFKQKIELVQLLSYAIWSLHPIVPVNSNIKKLEDLAGKRVGPGPAGGSTTLLWRLMFARAGLADKVRWSYGSWRETYDGLKAGSIDCIGSILIDGRPSTILTELEATMKVRPLIIDRGLIEAVQQDNPGAFLHTVTPDRWAALDGPIDTSSSSGIIGTGPELDDETGYTIVKTIYENAEDIRKVSPDLGMIRLDMATKYLLRGYPVNGGAARYFKEKGVWRDDLTIRA